MQKFSGMSHSCNTCKHIYLHNKLSNIHMKILCLAKLNFHKVCKHSWSHFIYFQITDVIYIYHTLHNAYSILKLRNNTCTWVNPSWYQNPCKGFQHLVNKRPSINVLKKQDKTWEYMTKRATKLRNSTFSELSFIGVRGICLRNSFYPTSDFWTCP